MRNDAEWIISDRDSDMHRLDWGRKNPDKLKKEIFQFYAEIGETINLKEKYPLLFNE